MNKKPIEVGDLVIVAYPRECCGLDTGLGKMFTVDFIHQCDGMCAACHSFIGGTYAGYHAAGRDFYYHVRELKKIPPFPELADEKADDRISDLVFLD